MASTVFDTLKAAKALKAAGFDDSQAEAVVATVGGAVKESLVTKADLEGALKPMVTKADLERALKPMVTKVDLERALKLMVTKVDLERALERMVTKTDLVVSQQRITIRLGGLLVAGISALAVLIGLF